ncbi:hypothetical protein SAMN05444266_10654 [Chitinophaga jiangningensis]|uniref:Uncharacterized protein n=1 Tax=Chitinophaga jiangningensis TaxID=1419482 RepID=A0A1M7FA14_9BACT|nr:hypothetical protein [Chitinophaga jiangningensis]SHM00840.1 hypothetical protein SAMN05444266_10654 [Chitinophaga jiangningensis]
MYRVLCLLALSATMACQNNQSHEDADQIAVAAPAAALDLNATPMAAAMELHADVAWNNVEVFDFANARVNNKLPLYATRSQFQQAWGAADSLFTPDYNAICGQLDEDFQYAYTAGSLFEIGRDSVVCDQFYFQPQTRLTSGNITLHNRITWEDARKLFPMAVQQAENEGKSDVILLRESPNGDAGILLHFREGMLSSISYNLPC